MHDDWEDFREIEARVTAQDRLDLHFEHQDALNVERGTWALTDYLRRFSEVRVAVGDHNFKGDILAVGQDWVHLSPAIVRVQACDEVTPSGEGSPASSVLDFRQAVRQMAGRIPREIILRSGQSRLVVIDWVAKDFLHARVEGRQVVVPLAQVAVVFGRVDLG